MDSKRAETQHVSRNVSIGGSKSGVGKSTTTMAALDCLLAKGSSVVLVECDNANPDVYRAYQHLVPAERTDLDDAGRLDSPSQSLR
jgi:Mrp family chromosome partitioning ATPase